MSESPSSRSRSKSGSRTKTKSIYDDQDTTSLDMSDSQSNAETGGNIYHLIHRKKNEKDNILYIFLGNSKLTNNELAKHNPDINYKKFGSNIVRVPSPIYPHDTHRIIRSKIHSYIQNASSKDINKSGLKIDTLNQLYIWKKEATTIYILNLFINNVFRHKRIIESKKFFQNVKIYFDTKYSNTEEYLHELETTKYPNTVTIIEANIILDELFYHKKQYIQYYYDIFDFHYPNYKLEIDPYNVKDGLTPDPNFVRDDGSIAGAVKKSIFKNEQIRYPKYIYFTSLNDLKEHFNTKKTYSDKQILFGIIHKYFPKYVPDVQLKDHEQNFMKTNLEIIDKFYNMEFDKEIMNKEHYNINYDILNIKYLYIRVASKKHDVIPVLNIFNKFETSSRIPVIKLYNDLGNHQYKVHKSLLAPTEDNIIEFNERIKYQMFDKPPISESQNKKEKDYQHYLTFYIKISEEHNIYYAVTLFDNGRYDILYNFLRVNNMDITTIANTFDIVNNLIESCNSILLNLHNFHTLKKNLFEYDYDYIKIQNLTVDSDNLIYEKEIANLPRWISEFAQPLFQLISIRELTDSKKIMNVKYKRYDKYNENEAIKECFFKQLINIADEKEQRAVVGKKQKIDDRDIAIMEFFKIERHLWNRDAVIVEGDTKSINQYRHQIFNIRNSINITIEENSYISIRYNNLEKYKDIKLIHRYINIGCTILTTKILASQYYTGNLYANTNAFLRLLNNSKFVSLAKAVSKKKSQTAIAAVSSSESKSESKSKTKSESLSNLVSNMIMNDEKKSDSDSVSGFGNMFTTFENEQSDKNEKNDNIKEVQNGQKNDIDDQSNEYEENGRVKQPDIVRGDMKKDVGDQMDVGENHLHLLKSGKNADLIKEKEKGKGKKEGKDPRISIVFKQTKQTDKEFFDEEDKKNQAGTDNAKTKGVVYSSKCQTSDYKTPVVINQKEKTWIDKHHEGAYIGYMKVGLTKHTYDKYYYICPDYWCPYARVALNKKQYKKLGGICPTGQTGKKLKNSEEPIKFVGNHTFIIDSKDPEDYIYRLPSFLGKTSYPCCGNKIRVDDEHIGFTDKTRDIQRLELMDDSRKGRMKRIITSASGSSASGTYIRKSKNSYRLRKGNYGQLPSNIIDYLTDDSLYGILKSSSDSLSGKITGIFRQGMDSNSNNNFIEVAIELMENPAIKTIKDLVKIMRKHMTPLDFIMLNNGNILKKFYNPTLTPNDDALFKQIQKYVKWIGQEKNIKYLTKFNLEKVIRAAAKIKTMKDFDNFINNQPNIYDALLIELMIFNSFENYLEFIEDPNIQIKDVDDFYDLFSMKYSDWLNVNKRFLVIFNVEDDVKLIEKKKKTIKTSYIYYPKNSNTSDLDHFTNIVCMYKHNLTFEPIVKLTENYKPSIKVFHYNANQTFLEKFNVLIEIFRNNNQTEEYRNLQICYEIFKELQQKSSTQVKTFVIDYNFKLTGFILITNLYIPLPFYVDIFTKDMMDHDTFSRLSYTYKENITNLKPNLQYVTFEYINDIISRITNVDFPFVNYTLDNENKINKTKGLYKRTLTNFYKVIKLIKLDDNIDKVIDSLDVFKKTKESTKTQEKELKSVKSKSSKSSGKSSSKSNSKSSSKSSGKSRSKSSDKSRSKSGGGKEDKDDKIIQESLNNNDLLTTITKDSEGFTKQFAAIDLLSIPENQIHKLSAMVLFDQKTVIPINIPDKHMKLFIQDIQNKYILIDSDIEFDLNQKRQFKILNYTTQLRKIIAHIAINKRYLDDLYYIKHKINPTSIIVKRDQIKEIINNILNQVKNDKITPDNGFIRPLSPEYVIKKDELKHYNDDENVKLHLSNDILLKDFNYIIDQMSKKNSYNRKTEFLISQRDYNNNILDKYIKELKNRYKFFYSSSEDYIQYLSFVNNVVLHDKGAEIRQKLLKGEGITVLKADLMLYKKDFKNGHEQGSKSQTIEKSKKVDIDTKSLLPTFAIYHKKYTGAQDARMYLLEIFSSVSMLRKQNYTVDMLKRYIEYGYNEQRASYDEKKLLDEMKNNKHFVTIAMEKLKLQSNKQKITMKDLNKVIKHESYKYAFYEIALLADLLKLNVVILGTPANREHHLPYFDKLRCFNNGSHIYLILYLDENFDFHLMSTKRLKHIVYDHKFFYDNRIEYDFFTKNILEKYCKKYVKVNDEKLELDLRGENTSTLTLTLTSDNTSEGTSSEDSNSSTESDTNSNLVSKSKKSKSSKSSTESDTNSNLVSKSKSKKSKSSKSSTESDTNSNLVIKNKSKKSKSSKSSTESDTNSNSVSKSNS
jgi:hypothetical protein